MAISRLPLLTTLVLASGLCGCGSQDRATTPATVPTAGSGTPVPVAAAGVAATTLPAPPVSAAELQKELLAEGHVALHLNFDANKTTVRPEAQPVLTEVATLLQQNPGLRLAVEGHTDNAGTPAHNQQLSAGRARAVVAALLAQGIAPDRLSDDGFGATRPLADNATEAGRAQNRRVELVRQ